MSVLVSSIFLNSNGWETTQIYMKKGIDFSDIVKLDSSIKQKKNSYLLADNIHDIRTEQNRSELTQQD